MKKTLAILFAAVLLVICAAAAAADSADGAVFVLSAQDARPGDTITVTVSLVNPVQAKSMALRPSYDETKMDLIDFEWLITGAVMADAGTVDDPFAVLAYSSSVEVSGDVFRYTFKIHDDAEDGDYAVGLSEAVIKVKEGAEDLETEMPVNVVPAKIPVYDMTVSFYAENAVVRAGEEVTVYILSESEFPVKSMMISDLDYDTNAFEFVEGKWMLLGAMIQDDWDADKKDGVITFKDSATMEEGDVYAVTFRAADDIEGDDFTVSFRITLRYVKDGAEHEARVLTTPGKITVQRYIRGDVNDDEVVNSNDAIYLLRYTMSPERYPINQPGDMNGDGQTNSNDAIYLLRHVMSPERYPLS